jgi:hypothetical protein
MDAGSKSQIIKIIKKNGPSGSTSLARALGISTQALHRHLVQLTRQGVLKKLGSPPKTLYGLGDERLVTSGATTYMHACREIFSSHPEVLLVTLFGSQATGKAKPKSDIDVLVWVRADAGFGKNEVWQYWDRHARNLPWANSVSLIVRRWHSELCLDTLLLDLPEEHILIYDANDYFVRLKTAVERWRTRWQAEKVPTFGGRHFWKYSTIVKKLSEIDFSLGIDDVT